jgi:hypothetical protein
MDDSSVVEYVDVSLEDRVQRRRSLYNDRDGTTNEQSRRDEIPEDWMSELETYVGDGLARVTVSGALSSSHHYHKAEAFVSVSVACNNNMEDVGAVHNLLRPKVQELVDKDHEEMSLLRDNLLPENEKKHTAPTGLPSGKPSSSKVAKPPAKRASKVSTKKPGVVKPNFRR